MQKQRRNVSTLSKTEVEKEMQKKKGKTGGNLEKERRYGGEMYKK